MALASYVQTPETVDYTPTQAVTAGDIVIQGDLVGIAKLDIAANALGSLAVEGIFDVVKAAGEGVAFTAGAKVYWDADNEVAVATATGNKLLGLAVKAAADADTTVRVVLVNADPVLAITAAAAVADAGALTAAEPDALTAAAEALTATDPAELTSPAAGAGSGADGTTFSGAQCDALRADVSEIRDKLMLALDDAIAQKAILDAVIADVLSIHTQLSADITDDADVHDQLNALLASLRAGGYVAAA